MVVLQKEEKGWILMVITLFFLAYARPVFRSFALMYSRPPQIKVCFVLSIS